MVVIHYTAMRSADAACATLCNPLNEVSAHYLIDEDGSLRTMVAEDMRAWHAGAGAWRDVTDVNSRSIGIELANDGFSPFGMGQMDALVDLLQGIKTRWAIQPERIIGHSDMAPGRKIDPGGRFDWRRLALEGLSVWPEPALGNLIDFRKHARAFGYPDVPDDLLLQVLRLRFRPWATGPLSVADAGLMGDLAARFGVDESTPIS